MPDCSLPIRIATDAARGVVTSEAARKYVRNSCPCAACEASRAPVRMPALPWWTPYPSPRPCPPDAATCPYQGMRLAVLAPREMVAFDAGVLV